MTTRRISLRASVVALFTILTPLWSLSHAAQPGYAELVRRVGPSVVTVVVEQLGPGAGLRAAERATANTDYDADAAVRTIIRRLLAGPGDNSGTGEDGLVIGSGFVVSPEGLIVTNRHVVDGARTIRVKLSDGKEVSAKLIGTDAATDIALLKTNAGHLAALSLGSSVNAAVGDVVIAIGNPYGLGQTVTAGIISARGRTLEDDPYIDFLQTDAAINRGNSGGPLLSADGIVLGVTSVIYSPTGGSIGLGFAIPAETVASVVKEIELHGRVDRGYLGIAAQALTPAIATALGLKAPDGALVTAIEPDGPAASTIHVGDVLLSLGGTPVTFSTLPKQTARIHPGSKIVVTVMRDGVQLGVPITIGRLPDPPSDSAQSGGADTWVANLACGVANTTPEIRKAIKAGDESNGLIVTQIRRTGPAAFAGLKVGDLITHAGTKQLNDVSDLASVNAPTIKLPLLVRIIRDGAPSFIALTGSDER